MAHAIGSAPTSRKNRGLFLLFLATVILVLMGIPFNFMYLTGALSRTSTVAAEFDVGSPMQQELIAHYHSLSRHMESPVMFAPWTAPFTMPINPVEFQTGERLPEHLQRAGQPQD
jgi:hypothetical protein